MSTVGLLVLERAGTQIDADPTTLARRPPRTTQGKSLAWCLVRVPGGIAPASGPVDRFHASRHRPRRRLPRLLAARPHRHGTYAQRAAGRRPADPHARPRPLLPEGAPAA